MTAQPGTQPDPGGTPAPTPPAPPAAPPPPQADPPGTGGDTYEELKEALAKERSNAKGKAASDRRVAELEAELLKAREAGQTEAEKAIEQARREGAESARSEERRQAGAKLARAAFDAAAGRRNPDLKAEDIDGILELVDLSKFLDDSGDPDPEAIGKAVERLVTEPQKGLPGGGFDLGNRGGGGSQYSDTPQGHLEAGIAEAMGGGAARR
jgi:hypothetical protein